MQGFDRRTTIWRYGITMGVLKATFSFDESTIAQLNDAAQRLAKPQSEVVRNVIHDYHERIGKLSEKERLRLLEVFDELVPRIRARPGPETDREIASLRRARRAGGRKSLGGASR
jgi:hypothetical protein